MSSKELVELYLLKCASLKIAVAEVSPNSSRDGRLAVVDESLSPFISQFSAEVRDNADEMAKYYKLFYMLENDTRQLIDDTLTEAYGQNWWDDHVPQNVKEEYKLNQQRESDAGVSSRSENPLHYISFGQLGEIIRANWDIFGGMLSNQKALGRVMFGLNMLRGPIAHCGVLAEDEIERLMLTVKDWFRLLEGPKQK
jgi:hypothetical protein